MHARTVVGDITLQRNTTGHRSDAKIHVFSSQKDDNSIVF